MEIVIKDNKRNWQIVKDNRRYLFPPKIRLAFKICILVYAVLVLINVLMRQFKLWMAFVLPIAIIVFEVQIYYFAKKTINLQKEIFKYADILVDGKFEEIFKKEEISFDLVFLDEGIDMIQESQHTFIEYKTIKEVIDTGTLIMMLTRAGAVLYFEKKNATKTQYEGIREIFEKKNILCKMKNI